jgi:hypothetical protein
MLAGVSVDYYIRLERGNVGGVSDAVLEAVASALQLDDAERAYLLDLVQATRNGTQPSPGPARVQVRETVQFLLDAINSPAQLRNLRMDVLASNAWDHALNASAYDTDDRPVNMARFFFLDPRARAFYVDWEELAPATAALLRAESGRHPEDLGLTDLVSQLKAGSETFRDAWASHEVHFYVFGMANPVRLRHPEVGELSLNFELMELVSDPGLRIAVFTAEPGSASEEALGALTRPLAASRS